MLHRRVGSWMLILAFILIVATYIPTSLRQTFTQLVPWRAQNDLVDNRSTQSSASTVDYAPSKIWTFVTQFRSSENSSKSQSEYSEAVVENKMEEFSLDAAYDEDYESQLKDGQRQAILNFLNTKQDSLRQHKIQTLYTIDGHLQWKSFLDGLPDQDMPPLTKFAQNYIWEQQNPSSCANKQYLVMEKFPNDEAFGLGATIYSISINLDIALRTGRILLYSSSSSPGQHFFEPQVQEEEPLGCGRSLSCIFEPLSICGADLTSSTNTIILPPRTQVDDVYVSTPMTSVPPVLGFAMKHRYPNITPDALKYWWRMQATAYIMRINHQTMTGIKSLREDASLHRQAGKTTETLSQTPSMPFPLPVGSFSMHVRHGDKGKEMRLIPFLDYISKAEQFIRQNPLHYQKIGFISTEDPLVIDEAINLVQTSSIELSFKERTTKDRNWSFYWDDIPRINGSPEEQLVSFGNRTETTIKWLLQLMTSIEADGFIGTRNSFWCRIIDSLRCIWIANCQAPFIEVGDERDWVSDINCVQRQNRDD